MVRWILAVTFSLAAAGSLAHPGGLDSHGGHYNRSTGEYHCHTQACKAQHGQADEAFKEAQQSNRSFTQTYDRDDWNHWIDEDGDCQNLRHELLIANSKSPVRYTSGSHCYVDSGAWLDPYSGKMFRDAQDTHIDHVVPLYWAHRHGGASWSEAKKERFANDPENLLVVSATLNMEKSADGPAKWLPPAMPRCQYVHVFQHIVEKYNLEPDAATKQVFRSCR